MLHNYHQIEMNRDQIIDEHQSKVFHELGKPESQRNQDLLNYLLAQIVERKQELAIDEYKRELGKPQDTRNPELLQFLGNQLPLGYYYFIINYVSYCL